MSNNNRMETLKKSQLTGRAYSFVMDTLYLVNGTGNAFINDYFYRLDEKTKIVAGDILMSVEDIKKIYSPYFKVEYSQDRVRCEYFDTVVELSAGDKNILVDGKKISLNNSPEKMGNNIGIPVLQIMRDVFLLSVDQKDDFTGISFIPGFKIESEMIRLKKLHSREKKTGDIRLAYWTDRINKINTYRIYIPTKYERGSGHKLIICLHGATGNSSSLFNVSDNMLSYYAEKHNFILLAPNSYVAASNYGGALPPVGMFSFNPDIQISGNPGYYSEITMQENKIAEKLVYEVFERIFAEYNIDRSRVYIMGNSMGAVGTFHLMCENPGMFKAAAPAGALPMVEHLEYEKIKDVPIKFIVGTEDESCAHYSRDCCDFLLEKGVNISLNFVGGGIHKTAWTYLLEEIFEFFESVG